MTGQVLVSSVIALTAASLAATPAMADQLQPTSIGQVSINGSAPNANGSGLQATATLTGPTGSQGNSMTLTVTNGSSSYTDVKAVDGVANYAGYAPLSSASAGSTACSVMQSGGGSFSCPGLSVAPGQSVTVTLTFPAVVVGDPVGGEGTYHGAGLQSVNVIYDTIDVNQSPMTSNGEGLQVKAILIRGNCPDFPSLANAWCLNVVNSPQNGTQIDDVDLAMNDPAPNSIGAQIQTIIPPIGGAYVASNPDPDVPCGLEQDPVLGHALYCETYFGQSEFELNFTNPSYAGGLGGIDVGFMSTPCANTANVGQVDLDSPFADAPVGSCQLPSHTKVTTARIDEPQHTARFTFLAKRASKFRCVLTRNGRVLFAHACRSPKDYAGKLPGGKYVFMVSGLNRAGVDPHPAMKRFLLK